MRRKVYGQSRIEHCVFCGRRALKLNRQGLPCCGDHQARQMDPRCACGRLLEIRKSKWGPYFFCMSCGCISLRKGLEINTGRKPTEITVRSDEL